MRTKRNHQSPRTAWELDAKHGKTQTLILVQTQTSRETMGETPDSLNYIFSIYIKCKYWTRESQR